MHIFAHCCTVDYTVSCSPAAVAEWTCMWGVPAIVCVQEVHVWDLVPHYYSHLVVIRGRWKMMVFVITRKECMGLRAV